MSDEDIVTTAIEASIHPQAIGWWVLAALAAIVGLAVFVQALARQGNLESRDYSTLAALGADRRQLVALGLARSFVVGLGGGLGALLVAAALSPIAPLGEARIAESYTGVSFDRARSPTRGGRHYRARFRPRNIAGSTRRAYLGFKGPQTTGPSLGPRCWPRSDGRTAECCDRCCATPLSAGAARRTSRSSPPSSGRSSPSPRCAGPEVFGASLSHLTATPRLYGDAFQLNFTDPGGTGPDRALLKSLEHNRAVSAITEGFAVEVSVNKVPVGAVAGRPLRGNLLLSTVAGLRRTGRARSASGLRRCA